MTLQTVLLYHSVQDLETEASILDIKPIDSDSIEIILDRTIFHPQGGGQPSDSGAIKTDSGEILVKIVKFNGSIVSHICSIPDFELKLGSTVSLLVDRQNRLLNSALHTAGHLIFSMVRNHSDLVEKKGHHFPSGSYVEFTGIWNGDLDQFSKDINSAIQDDLKIFYSFKDGKRFVQIQGFAECASHLESLGILKIVDIKKIKIAKGGGGGQSHIMDILKAEIERKRKQLDSVSKGAKYFKRSELEDIKVSVEKPKVEKVIEKKESPKDHDQDVPLEEIIRRFRAKNEPIKLFDESDSDRLMRLAKIESKNDSLNGQRNDYLALLDANEEKSEFSNVYGTIKNAGWKDLDNAEFNTALITLDNFDNKPQWVSKLISVYFQRIIRDWEDFLEKRPGEEKKSLDGKRAAGNCSQTKEYLKPFFKKLRKGQIASEILVKIVEICELLQIREYQKANDVYLKLSIGNAAWPIGISGTSIHERSALERIETSKSAGHVLNDEVTLYQIYLKDYEKMDPKH